MSASNGKKLTIQSRIDYADFSLDIDNELQLKGVTGLFGPSGGGKSTLLRVIAGLNQNAGGQVSFAETDWQKESLFVPAHKRQVGYVFQDARLFEHLSVAGNLRFALDRSGPGEKNNSFDDVVDALDLHSLLNRGVAELSGGERQRVAIARTMLSQPELLLLDEPLAALDADRKREIYPTIAALPDRFGVPIIFVSHAVDEMAQLTESVVVLEAGRIVAEASTEKILSRDSLHGSIQAFEAMSVLDVTVVEQLESLHLVRVDHRGQSLTIPSHAGVQNGAALRLLVRAGDVVLATEKPQGLSVRNILSGTIIDIDLNPDSAFAVVSVDVDGTVINAQITNQAVQALNLQSGKNVYVLLKTASFDRPSA